MNENLARIAMSKSICKEYSNSNDERIVYLNNGDEFQIQLFNPYDYVISCYITVNNEYLGNDLVLRPGERLWLERYLNSSNKFKFSTYTVEGNNETVKNAIKNNGVIEIKFYKEKQEEKIQINNFINWSYQPYIHEPATVKYNFAPKSFEYYNTCDIANTVLTANCDLGLSSVTTASSNSNTQYTSCSTVKDLNYEYKPTDNYSASISKGISRKLKDESIETGRIEKGSYSNQKFINVDYDFEDYPFRTEKIHILPLSQKKVNKGDLEKIYCFNCGRKLKNKYKFCPYCGKQIE